jgi:hypothetical protein
VSGNIDSWSSATSSLSLSPPQAETIALTAQATATVRTLGINPLPGPVRLMGSRVAAEPSGSGEASLGYRYLAFHLVRVEVAPIFVRPSFCEAKVSVPEPPPGIRSGSEIASSSLSNSPSRQRAHVVGL